MTFSIHVSQASTYEKANISILFIHILYFMVVFEIHFVNFRIWGVTQRRFYWP